MKKAGIYKRVSTDEQIEGTSLGSQEVDGRRTAEAEAYEVAEVYSDEGISGTIYDRPELQRALSDLEAGKIDALICWDVSRLSRNVEHQQRILRRIRSAGGRLILCRGGFEDTDEGDLMFGISGSFAQYERRVFRSRSMRGRKALAESGVQPSRAKSPYGFHIVTKNEKIEGLYADRAAGDYVLIEAEAYWIREIFRLFDAGKSLSAIARHLNDHGVPTPKDGREWRASSVRVVILNPLYVGRVSYGKSTYIIDESFMHRRDPSRKLKNGKRKIEKPEADWMAIETAIVSLVDEETWKRCAARMAVNADVKKAVFGGNPHRKFLLSGLAFCPSCGWRIGGKTAAGKQRYYRCDGNKECTAPKSCYRADLMEALLVKSLQMLHDEPSTIEEAIENYDAHQRAQEAGGEQERERERLTAELDALQTRAQATAKAMTAAVMAGASSEDFSSLFAEIAARRQTIEARLRELVPVDREVNKKESQSAAEKLAVIAGLIVKVFEAPDEDYSPIEKQALLLPIVERIIPSQDGKSLFVLWKSETLHCISMS